MAAVVPGTSSSTEASDKLDLLFRLRYLIFDCGHTALANYVDNVLSVQATTLSACLANENPTIKLLKARRLIAQMQYDLLYPSSGTVSTSDLDITLIILLMRFLKCFKLNEKFNWNILPGESDTSIEADICRLRNFRNEIVHVHNDLSIQQNKFIQMSEEISTVLLRINKVYPIADFEQTINDIRYGPLDQKRNERVTEKLQTAESNMDEMLKPFQAQDSIFNIEVQVLGTKDSQEVAILDDIDLTKLLLKEGRTSREVFKECQKICQAIKDESEHIVHVEAAYRFGDDKHVIFLVFVAKNIQIDVIWETEKRIINNYSDESSVMLHCKENSPLTDEESQKIGEIIDRHSKKLMSDHKFLSAISASSVSSRCFGPMRLKHVIEKRPCIVLNVLVKGVIPLNEEYFPTTLEGTPVDVREGGVRLCVNKAEEYQENVTMGCKISSSTCPVKAGTLGGFIEHPEYGLCGITCAHVVSVDDDKFKLKVMSTITAKEQLDGIMYQPDIGVPNNKLGKLVQVTYKEGENGKPGVDLALFRIETRAPKQGRFPDNTLPAFNEGLVWEKTGIPDGLTEVRKFGYVTLNTSGVMQFNNCAIREVPFHSFMTVGDDRLPLTTTLNKQYEIKSCEENIPFCKEGDSGALVFMEDNTGEEPKLRCIGMLVAVMPGNSGCVTPINAILDELKVKQFKPFTTHSTTHALLEQISGMLKTHFDGVNKRLEKLEERMSRIEVSLQDLVNVCQRNT